ncbi:hypothetical protein KAU11_05940, partial [Candidatus Babeliales bacterium]|nr:hypothetical protein [Candidatus Babeliales bacterium]
MRNKLILLVLLAYSGPVSMTQTSTTSAPAVAPSATSYRAAPVVQSGHATMVTDLKIAEQEKEIQALEKWETSVSGLTEASAQIKVDVDEGQLKKLKTQLTVKFPISKRGSYKWRVARLATTDGYADLAVKMHSFRKILWYLMHKLEKYRVSDKKSSYYYTGKD